MYDPLKLCSPFYNDKDKMSTYFSSLFLRLTY